MMRESFEEQMKRVDREILELRRRPTSSVDSDEDQPKLTGSLSDIIFNPADINSKMSTSIDSTLSSNLYGVMIRYTNESTQKVEITVGYLHNLDDVEGKYSVNDSNLGLIDIEDQFKLKSRIETEVSNLYNIPEQLKEGTSYTFTAILVDHDRIRTWLRGTSTNMRRAFKDRFSSTFDIVSN